MTLCCAFVFGKYPYLSTDSFLIQSLDAHGNFLIPQRLPRLSRGVWENKIIDIYGAELFTLDSLNMLN